MKHLLFYEAVFVFLAATGYAINVELESDKTQLLVNETISFRLAVTDGGSAAGGFSVYRKVNGTFQQARRTTFTSSCTMCKGTSPLGDLNETTSFIPLHAGEYIAVANYGGVSRQINFTVLPVTTTTTSTTTLQTTSRATTTSTTSSTTSTTSSTSTTSTSTTVPATLPETTTTTMPEYGRGNPTIIYFFGIILVVLVLVAGYTRKRT